MKTSQRLFPLLILLMGICLGSCGDDDNTPTTLNYITPSDLSSQFDSPEIRPLAISMRGIAQLPL